MSKHVMIDIETLGRDPGCVILSIGAVIFDLNGDIGESFYEKISVSDSLSKGFTINPDTFNWWLHQDSSVFREALSGQIELDLALGGLNGLSMFLVKNNISKFWANSPTFDLKILSHAFNVCTGYDPFTYWKKLVCLTL